MPYRLCLVILFCVLTPLTGCSPPGPKMYPISGEVTFEGIPVVDGQIRFTPDSGKGNAGPPGYAVITDGKYAASGKHSVMAGPYYVTLFGYSEPHHGGESDLRTALFAEIIKEIDVPAKASIHDFHLTKEDMDR